MLNPDQTVLLESVRARISVAPISLLGIVLPAVLFVPYVYSEGVPGIRIALWVLPVLLGMTARTIYSRRVSRTIETMTAEELASADHWLRISSVVNQTMMGLASGLFSRRPQKP